MPPSDFSNECFRIRDTPALQRREALLVAWLLRELERLEGTPPFAATSLAVHLPGLLSFGDGFHARYNAWLGEALAPQISRVRCSSGCSNCCHHFPISVEPFELLRLYEQLRPRADFSEILEGCFRRSEIYSRISHSVAANELESEDDREDRVLQQYFLQSHPCPMLSPEGLCSVHPWRPVTCRMYFSFSDPSYCVPAHLLGPNNRGFIVQLPDSIEELLQKIGEWYAPLGLRESLYGGLLDLNALEGEIWYGA